MNSTGRPDERGRNYTPRPRKLHIVRPAANGRSHSFRCSSSPHKVFRPCGAPMCPCVLRSIVTVTTNDGHFWICMQITGLRPAPVNRLPSSSQAPYRSPRRKRQVSFIPLLVLSPQNLRFCGGPILKRGDILSRARIFQYLSVREANGSLPLPEPLIRAAKDFSASTT